MGDPTSYNWLGGSGGGLGYGGAGPVNTSGTSGSFSGSDYSLSYPNCSYNCFHIYVGAAMSKYPPHNETMQLTRQIVWDNSYGSVQQPFNGASLSGQIITMYQAQACGALR